MNVTYVNNDSVWVAGVRADDKFGIIIRPTLHDKVMKLPTKHVLACIVHVIAVTDHRHDSLRKPRQHVAVCFQFTVTCPCRHSTVQSHTPSLSQSHMPSLYHCTAQLHSRDLHGPGRNLCGPVAWPIAKDIHIYFFYAAAFLQHHSESLFYTVAYT